MSSPSPQNPNRYVNDLNRLKAQRSELQPFLAVSPFFKLPFGRIHLPRPCDVTNMIAIRSPFMSNGMTPTL